MSFSLPALIMILAIAWPHIFYWIAPARHQPSETGGNNIWVDILQWGGFLAFAVLLIFFGEQHHEEAHSHVYMLVVMAICAIAYYVMWIGYFRDGRQYNYLKRNALLLGVLPAIYVIFAACYLENIYALIASVLFACGYMLNAYRLYKQTGSPQ